MRETAMQSQKKSSSWLNIGRDFNTMTWVLMPVAIAINMAVGQIVATLRLPGTVTRWSGEWPCTSADGEATRNSSAGSSNGR